MVRYVSGLIAAQSDQLRVADDGSVESIDETAGIMEYTGNPFLLAAIERARNGV